MSPFLSNIITFYTPFASWYSKKGRDFGTLNIAKLRNMKLSFYPPNLTCTRSSKNIIAQNHNIIRIAYHCHYITLYTTDQEFWNDFKYENRSSFRQCLPIINILGVYLAPKYQFPWTMGHNLIFFCHCLEFVESYMTYKLRIYKESSVFIYFLTLLRWLVSPRNKFL